MFDLVGVASAVGIQGMISRDRDSLLLSSARQLLVEFISFQHPKIRGNYSIGASLQNSKTVLLKTHISFAFSPKKAIHLPYLPIGEYSSLETSLVMVHYVLYTWRTHELWSYTKWGGIGNK